MAAQVKLDIAPLTRFRYASYPEIEWGLIEAQTIHWPSAPVKGGRIETHTTSPPFIPPVWGLILAILYIEYNIFLGAPGPPDPPGGVF